MEAQLQEPTAPSPRDTPAILPEVPVEEPPKPETPFDDPASDIDAPTKEPPTGPDDVEPRIDDPRVPGQPGRIDV